MSTAKDGKTALKEDLAKIIEWLQIENEVLKESISNPTLVNTCDTLRAPKLFKFGGKP